METIWSASPGENRCLYPGCQKIRFPPRLFLILDGPLQCVCAEYEWWSNLDVCSSQSNAYACAVQFLCIVTLCTNMLKGQGCHFPPYGSLFWMVRHVASEDEAKEKRRQVTGGQPHCWSKAALSNKACGCHLQPEIKLTHKYNLKLSLRVGQSH